MFLIITISLSTHEKEGDKPYIRTIRRHLTIAQAYACEYTGEKIRDMVTDLITYTKKECPKWAPEHDKIAMSVELRDDWNKPPLIENRIRWRSRLAENLGEDDPRVSYVRLLHTITISLVANCLEWHQANVGGKVDG